MMTIKPIEKDQYHYPVEWNAGKDADYLSQWAGIKYQYPLTVEQIAERDAMENVHIYAAFQEDSEKNEPAMVGCVELEEMTPGQAGNVARFIVAEQEQGKGLGALILKSLIDTAFTTLGLTKLSLRVYCYNAAAIRCYEKCGFRVKKYLPGEQPKWNCYSMELRKEWLQM